MNRMESEQIAELTTDDIAKLKDEKLSYGCVIFLIAVLLIGGLFLAYIVNLPIKGANGLIIMGVYILLSIAIFWFSFTTIKRKNELIDQDILGMKKKIIVAPIQSKRIESSEITTGRDKGGVELKYFMTIRGEEYDMTERRYLMIKVGEFMELHQAPNSKIIVRQIWLKEDSQEEDDLEG